MQHCFEKRAVNHHENAFYLQKRVRGERVPQFPPPMIFSAAGGEILGFFLGVEVKKICHKKVTKLFTKNFTCPSPSENPHCFGTSSPQSYSFFFSGSWGDWGSSPQLFEPAAGGKIWGIFWGWRSKKVEKNCHQKVTKTMQ